MRAPQVSHPIIRRSKQTTEEHPNSSHSRISKNLPFQIKRTSHSLSNLEKQDHKVFWDRRNSHLRIITSLHQANSILPIIILLIISKATLISKGIIIYRISTINLIKGKEFRHHFPTSIAFWDNSNRIIKLIRSFRRIPILSLVVQVRIPRQLVQMLLG